MRRLVMLGVTGAVVCLLPAPANAQSTHGLGLQVYARATSGWTVRERDPLENRTTDIRLSSGGGLGLRLSYDILGWMAAYGAADVNAEREGLYQSYGAGLLIRPRPNPQLRLFARVGGRIIDPVTPLAYADLALGVEWFIGPTLAVNLDLNASPSGLLGIPPDSGWLA